MIISGVAVEVCQGDITQIETEAIVNACDTLFSMAGGLAGVIKEKAGAQIQVAAQKQCPVNAGEAIVTEGGNLKARFVIHAVTMKPQGTSDIGIVRRATARALLCAHDQGVSGLAFCALGCGRGGVSYEMASKVMAQEVFGYLRTHKDVGLKKIVFVLQTKEAFSIFQKNVCGYLGYINSKISEGPFLTVDGIVVYGDGIVMVERSNPPFGWALPGGFVDYGESVEEAVVREVKEETGLTFTQIRQFKVCSDPARDPRFHTASVVFVGRGEGTLQAASDAQSAKIVSLKDLPDDIAFDHRQVIEEYRSSLPC